MPRVHYTLQQTISEVLSFSAEYTTKVRKQTNSDSVCHALRLARKKQPKRMRLFAEATLPTDAH